MCSTVQDDFCNYFLFNRNDSSCVLIQNYKKIIPDALEKYADCDNITLEVYRRHRYTGKERLHRVPCSKENKCHYLPAHRSITDNARKKTSVIF